MIIVTNKIRTKLGAAEKMAPGFTRPGALQQMDGFIKVEVTMTQNKPDHDELNVSMYWENHDNYEAWKNSDVFKQAHKRPEPGSSGAPKESPILGNEIVIEEVVSILEAIPAT